MFMFLEIQIIISVFFTSFVSGIFGMAGGMVLMGIFGIILPINLGMVYHGISQCAANGFRAFLNKKDIDYSILKSYLIGTIVAMGILRVVNFEPNLAMLYIGLGFFPLISLIPKLGHNVDIGKKNMPFYCGFIVTAAQIFAGASGGLLDLFYYKSQYNRFAVIANKAFTQAFAHFLKIIYFASFASTYQSVKLSQIATLIPFIIVAALLGTIFGKQVLYRVDELKFKLFSKWLIMSISCYMIAKGIILISG